MGRKQNEIDIWKLDMRVHVLIQHGSFYDEPTNNK